MATPLDIGVLKQFSGIFPFLLILVLTYGILSMTEWFKEKKGLAALIALIAAIMTLFSPIAIKTVNMMAPWFVILLIFMFLFILAFMMFGYGQKDITEFVTKGEYGVGSWVMALMLLIGVGSLVTVINEERGFSALTGSNASANMTAVEAGFWQTVFHPKILGMILVLLIAYFTVRQMTKTE